MVEEAPTTWAGLALVVGPGGIGAAVAAELKRPCPDLKVLTAGRHGPPASSLQLDLQNDSDLDGLSSSLRAQGLPLRLVFNCSGRLHGPGLQPEKRLQQIDRSQLEEQWATTAGPRPRRPRATGPWRRGDHPFHSPGRGARGGGRGANRPGGGYGNGGARGPKNQFRRGGGLEGARRWPLATVSLLHPGTTDTALSRPFQSFVAPDKLFTPERAARQLVEVLLQQTPEQSGGFLAWDGQSIDW